jgi:hypothetical protein
MKLVHTFMYIDHVMVSANKKTQNYSAREKDWK